MWKSERLAKVSLHQGIPSLSLLNANIKLSMIEDLNPSELKDIAFLLLERQTAERYRVLEKIPTGSILDKIYQRIWELELDSSFGEDAERELAEWLAKGIEPEACEDLRQLDFVTIDGAGTLDLDQALYIERIQDPSRPRLAYRVYYAIADAAHYVQHDTALYAEALKRGSSFYFIGRSVPMLPRALSQGLSSLNPQVDRRALVFVMLIDNAGRCAESELKRALIHSKAKLSNEDVDAFLEAPESHPFYLTSFRESLLNFERVGLLRLNESRIRNVVHFQRVGLTVKLSADKKTLDLGLDSRGKADLYNEQLSLLCNMEGAQVLARFAKEDPNVLAIFRNHEAPSERDLSELSETLHKIARAQGLPEPWIWRPERQSLADFFDSLPMHELEPDRAARIRQAYERQVLMIQRRSIFAPEAGPHSALGVNPYARFSAPMREIVGIFTHQEAIDALSPDANKLHGEANHNLRLKVIDAANRARALQRKLDKSIDSYAVAQVISQDYALPLEERPKRQGTILGMRSNAFYVRLDMPPIELKVYLKDINDNNSEDWKIDLERCTLHKLGQAQTWRIGDSMLLRVKDYFEENKKWRLIPVCDNQQK